MVLVRGKNQLDKIKNGVHVHVTKQKEDKAIELNNKKVSENHTSLVSEQLPLANVHKCGQIKTFV